MKSTDSLCSMVKLLFSLLVLVVIHKNTNAQAPSISYSSSPFTFPVNTTITPLTPSNTGGAIGSPTIVSTFAGSGASGSVDGTGTAASFYTPQGITVSGGGNIYVADYNNNRIRKITSTGVVTNYAGLIAGNANGTGTAASFSNPSGVAADGAGNAYVADQSNSTIRKVSLGSSVGVVSTFAGSGSPGSADGQGTSASFNYPGGVAVDASGNVYVADTYNHKIRRITPAGLVVTFVGSGSAGSADGTGAFASFNFPTGVAVDGAGNVYVADANNHLIRKITSAGVVTTFAGSGSQGFADGTGTAASFNFPTGVAINSSGIVYVTDYGNNKIRKITPAGVVTTLAGSGLQGSADGTAMAASFFNPNGVAVSGSSILYVTDESSNIIRKITIGTGGYSISPSLPNGLTFNETTGVISGTPTVATSATNYTITATNASGSSSTVISIATTIASLTPPFNALNFDGANDFVQTPAYGSPINTNFTVEAWVLPNDATNTITFISTREPQEFTFDAKLEAGNKITIDCGNGSNNFGTLLNFNYKYSVGKWMHVAIVFSGNNCTVYVNGVFINTLANATVSNPTLFTNTSYIKLGAVQNVQYFNGNIDEVRIWNTARTATDIQNNFRDTIAGNSAGLIAYYRFDHGTAGGTNTGVTSLANAVGSSLAGSLNNFALTGNTSNWVESYAMAIPTATAATSITSNGFTANWTAPTRGVVNGYKLQVSTDSTFATGAIAGSPFTVVGTSQAITGLTGSTKYYYRVSADKTSVTGQGGYSTVIVCTTSATVAAPNISYTGSPFTFTVSTPISPLIPANSGGAVGAPAMVSTFAGSGNIGSIDNTGTAASFNYPNSIAVDLAGNLFVTEGGSNNIRKITSAGVVSTLAGSGNVGSADGTGTAASFNYPEGVAVDATGNVFVADKGNHKIRKITSAGVVTTLAGSGVSGFADGTGAAASFNYPAGVAVDATGNVYVGDASNHRIRVISPAGVVTTLAGSGVPGSADGTGINASFTNPSGVALDAAGNIYVADLQNQKIRKISPAGIVTTLAGSGVSGSADGTGSNASFSNPTGVAVDVNNNVYVADYLNFKIRKISPAGLVTTLAGNGSAGATDGLPNSATFNFAPAVAVDAANTVFIADQNNQKIRRITTGSGGYSISPSLPIGLSIDGITGIISGTPTVASASTAYTITATNAGGSGNTIINIATTAAPALAPPGNALNFDGANDFVQTPAYGSTIQNNFTVEAWVRPNDTTNTITFISTREPQEFTFDAKLDAGNKITIDCGNGFNVFGSALNFNYKYAVGKWMHVAIVFSGTSCTVYVNGVSLGTQTNANISNPTLFTSTSFIKLGAVQTLQYFNGNIDEVRIWNTARTATDIQNNFRDTVAGNSAGLIAYYRFDHGTAGGTNTGLTSLANAAGSSLTGSLNNFALTGTTSNWVESYAMAIPTATAATSITSNGFTANWTAPIRGTVDNGYRLQVATDSTFATGAIAGSPFTITGTSRAITSLTANTKYFYRVSADKTSVTGQGGYSNVIAHVLTSTCTPTASTFTVSACGSYTWVAKGNKVYTANNTTDTIKLVNTAGCDSIVTINLTIKPLPASTITSTRPLTFCNGDSVILQGTIASNRTYQWLIGVNTLSNRTADTFVAKSSGSYKVRITNTLNGCSRTSSAAVVKVNALPTPATITGNALVCLSSTIQLVASKQGGWRSLDTNIATVSNTGLVTARSVGSVKINHTTLPNANGCTNTASVTVTTKGLPTISSTISGTKTACVGRTSQLSNSTPNGTWSSSNNSIATVSSTGLVNGIATGNVTITYTSAPSASGCVNKVSTGFSVTAPCLLRPEYSKSNTQPEEPNTKLEASIFPNPTGNVFNVLVKTPNKESISIRVMDVNGKTAYMAKGMPGQVFMFGEQLISGTYLVEVKQGDRRTIVKGLKL